MIIKIFQAVQKAISKVDFTWTNWFGVGFFGLVSCYTVGLLRGKSFTSIHFLRLTKLFIYFLAWWPINQISTVLSSLCLLYLPLYIDLSEHHFASKRKTLSSFFRFSFFQKFLRKHFNIKIIKTVDIEGLFTELCDYRTRL